MRVSYSSQGQDPQQQQQEQQQKGGDAATKICTFYLFLTGRTAVRLFAQDETDAGRKCLRPSGWGTS